MEQLFYRISTNQMLDGCPSSILCHGQLVRVWQSYTMGCVVSKGFLGRALGLIVCIVLPGIEPNRYQEWADILSHLIYVKPGNKRRLELEELQLDWLPLWERCRREIWPSQRAVDSRCVSGCLRSISMTNLSYD
jgi:hypothetical protein